MAMKTTLALAAFVLGITGVGTTQEAPSRSAALKPYEDIIGVQKDFDPAALGMTKLEAPDQLPQQLAVHGCPNGRTTEAFVPCAFISYGSAAMDPAAYQSALRPIFKVVGLKAWTVVKGSVAFVAIKDLEYARDLSDLSSPQRGPFPATAVVGVLENEKSCQERRPCADLSFFQKLLSDHNPISRSCLEAIWGNADPRSPRAKDCLT